MLITSLISAAAGWFAVMFALATVLLAYLARPTPLARRLGLAGGKAGTYLVRMQPHAWLGYAILMLSVLHAAGSMQMAAGARVAPQGVWLAAVALLLLAVQVWLGAALMQTKTSSRQRVRRWHFGVMLAVFAAVFAHVYLDSSLMR